MYNEQKAAQIAAWFLSQEGGQMPHLKLIKLMYLADRESMIKHGFPMTGDQFVSMPQGPVLSRTLNHINDAIESCPNGWDEWISDRAGHVVALAREVRPESLDEISKNDFSILEHTWKTYGWMSKYELRDFTHESKNCPEWVDPDGSSYPIRYETIFEAAGFTQDEAAKLGSEVRAQNKIEKLLSV